MTHALRLSLAALVLAAWLAPPAAAGTVMGFAATGPAGHLPGGTIHPGLVTGGVIDGRQLPGGPILATHFGGHVHGFVPRHGFFVFHGGFKPHVGRFKVFAPPVFVAPHVFFFQPRPVIVVPPPGAVILTPGWHWTGWNWIWVP